MDVRVGAGQRVPAVLAAAARLRILAGAQEPLAQPEREALLADAEWSVKQERPWQRVALDRVAESLTQRGMAVEWE